MGNRRTLTGRPDVRHLAAIGGLVAATLAHGAAAQELSYRLPQNTVVAGWQARLTRCPTARMAAGADCKVEEARGRRLAGKTVMVPHLSDCFILPLGSGAFESKSTSAEFTADGRLVSIGTSVGGGGAQVAEALAGGLAAAETMRDARTAAIQREIAEIKAENELELLREASDQITVSTP